MIKSYMIFILLCTSALYADDMSYKDRSDEGESKYERIGKLEGYVSKLSGNLEKIHKKMDKDFEKRLKALEVKMDKKRKDDLTKSMNELRKMINGLNSKISPLVKDGIVPDYALAKDAKSTQFEVDIHKDRLKELIDKVVKIEQQILDITQ